MFAELLLSTRILFGIESLYREHYDQGVVVRLLHSSSIIFTEWHVLVCPSLFKRGCRVHDFHLPLTCFLERPKWPAHGWPTCDRPYFFDHSLWSLRRAILIFGWEPALVFIIISKPAGFSFLHIVLQFFFLYQFLYLLLQVPAIFCIMTMVLWEPVVLLLISNVGGRM